MPIFMPYAKRVWLVLYAKRNVTGPFFRVQDLFENRLFKGGQGLCIHRDSFLLVAPLELLHTAS
jgi:hypothetical protein